MNGLPAEFEQKMRALLGGEYDEYEKCFDEPRHYGRRGRWSLFPGSGTGFIMMAKTASPRSIRIILRVCIISRNQAP